MAAGKLRHWHTAVKARALLWDSYYKPKAQAHLPQGARHPEGTKGEANTCKVIATLQGVGEQEEKG